MRATEAVQVAFKLTTKQQIKKLTSFDPNSIASVKLGAEELISLYLQLLVTAMYTDSSYQPY